jgi:SpoVK/Ycf46/Vps4 family AAA+-type ATPase
LPDISAIEEIMRIHLRQVPCDESIRLDELASQLVGYSGADVAQLCYRARSFPFVEVVRGGQTRPLILQDIKRAIAQAQPTVSSSMVRRFEEYAQQRAGMARSYA